MSSLARRAFVDTRTNLYFWTHDFLALLTIVSTISIVLETVPALEVYDVVFVTIEWVAVIIFTLEYIIRLRAEKRWQDYVFSVYGVIDLVSILPTYLGLGNFVFLKSARVVRIIRLLRLIRLAKLRHMRGHDIEHAGSMVALNITIYLTLLIGMLLCFGILLYLFESSTGVFESIPVAMWWTFQVFVASTFIEEPLTVVGGILYVAAKFVGLILLGALIGVVANIMQHYLLDPRK